MTATTQNRTGSAGLESADTDGSAHSGGSRLRIWIDGRVVDTPDEARVSALDHGLVVGDGVFEALKVTAAGPFAVQRHLDRMTRSARALGLPDPDHQTVRSAIEAVLAGREWAEGKIRITYTGGHGPLGSQAAYGPQTLIVAAEPREVSPAITTIATAPWRRNEHGALTGVKSTSYAENVRGLAYAHHHGASEAIFLNTAGNVCEGSGTNVFCVYGDRVVTPPLSAGPLAGITRELLLEWCAIEEADLTPTEAAQADEVFLTSSMRDVQAVRRWDELEYGAPGRITTQLAAEFARHSSDLIDP
ncbi:aminotransferase class IV [Microlunatus ginsengisoli]|uniref:Aminodeoxychorismate lyase n=1 Tax=Microlunatus ginsengisoli TaxID=363863 RepID=A0ABP7AEA0_9ACTN